MRYAKKAIIIIFVILLALILGAIYWIFVASPYDLPKGPLVFDRLKPPVTSSLVDGNGSVIFYFGRNDPVAFYRPLSQIDKKLQDWVVMLEDAKFYQHKGFDVEEIENSFKKNLQAGKIKRGGSGITQQLAKNLFLDKERSYARKVYEVPWTLKIESSLSKRQILELYLNSIEWGPGLAGAESAARYFFGKSCSSLTAGEAMYLALIIPSPSRFNLIRNPGALRSLETKRQWFVNRLVAEKKIPASEKQNYLAASFGILPLDSPERFHPAPVGAGFKAPEWAEFLKPFAKGRAPRVSILKTVQQLGADDNAWTTEASAAPGDSPDEDTDADGDSTPVAAAPAALATTWCASRGERLTGYWHFDDPQAPRPELRARLSALGDDLHSCEGLDLKRKLSQ